jgi:hypothetical protein
MSKTTVYISTKAVSFHKPTFVALNLRLDAQTLQLTAWKSGRHQFLVSVRHLVQGIHLNWVPCHDSMARPLVSDEGDGHQIWRIAANILNE